MRLFQFVKWLWDRNDAFDRTLICFGLWAIPCAISAIWLGKAAAFIYLGGVVAVVIPLILFCIFQIIKGFWDEFVDHYPPEDVQLVRKLKGISTPSKEKINIHEYY